MWRRSEILTAICPPGTPPYLGAYFAAKAGMDSLAVTYAGELARWGIETSLIIPGAYSKGTSHFAHSTSPEDKAVAAQYADGPYKGYDKKVGSHFASIFLSRYTCFA